jgi:two-component system, LuxR family, response regulator FixJ
MTGTVFIVDDDSALRDALAGLLDIAGLETAVYDGGPAFLTACSEESTGCVLLDIAMPGMDGKEVHAALNQRGIAMPVIFLTGHGDISMAVQAMHNGAVDFLEKPIKSAELVERVRRALKFDEENRRKKRYILDVRLRYDRLTPREREVMALVVCGKSNKVIARELALSPRTVEVHRTHVMNKMVAANLVELINMNAHCQS